MVLVDSYRDSLSKLFGVDPFVIAANSEEFVHKAATACFAHRFVSGALIIIAVMCLLMVIITVSSYGGHAKCGITFGKYIKKRLEVCCIVMWIMITVVFLAEVIPYSASFEVYAAAHIDELVRLVN